MGVLRERFVGVLAAVTVLTCGQAVAQSLEYPASSPVDQPIAIRAYGLTPAARVALKTSVEDASGQRWIAWADFLADADGTVDTGRDSTLAGSYHGVEIGGLFNRMHAVGDDEGLLRFQLPGLSSLTTTITLENEAGVTLDSLAVERFLLGPDVRITPVSDSALRGRLFSPSHSGAPGIVVLGGSDGGYPDALAALLATNGYAALSLAYFGADALPPELAQIPLDYIEHAIEWLGAQPGIGPGGIVLFGVSKGSEAALLAASHFSDVRAVVAYVPSSVAWSCVCSERDRSSWTLRGEPVEAVGPGSDPDYQPAPGEPIRPTVHYLYRLRQAEPSTEIAVERIAGPVLLIAGGDDQLWPSLQMAQAVMARRAGQGGHPDDQLLAYPRAGHLIGRACLPSGSTRVGRGRIETGGSPEQNARAQADAWPSVLQFLAGVAGR